jgi:hypothetical protein
MLWAIDKFLIRFLLIVALKKENIKPLNLYHYLAGVNDTVKHALLVSISMIKKNALPVSKTLVKHALRRNINDTGEVCSYF